MCTAGDPSLVFEHGEFLVDLVDRHQLLFPSATAWVRHIFHVYWFALFVQAHLATSGIIPEAVLNADNDPVFILVRLHAEWKKWQRDGRRAPIVQDSPEVGENHAEPKSNEEEERRGAVVIGVAGIGIPGRHGGGICRGGRRKGRRRG